MESIYHRDGKKWKYLFLENIYLDVLPQIGHTEAGHFPDQPFLEWRYTREKTDKKMKRNNTKEFIVAAKTIYGFLRAVNKSNSDAAIPWGDIEKDIQRLLAYRKEDVEKRCSKWRDRFQPLFDPLNFEYDRRAWRNDALGPEREVDTEWGDFKPSDFHQLQFPMKPDFYDSPWVQFHRAALRQRHLVLENLI